MKKKKQQLLAMCTDIHDTLQGILAKDDLL